jgi:hypothetical protein
MLGAMIALRTEVSSSVNKLPLRELPTPEISKGCAEHGQQVCSGSLRTGQKEEENREFKKSLR